jgi:multicomponent Na+:H+ antiporter subunit D
MTLHPPVIVEMVTTGAFLLVLAIVVPLAGALLAFAAGGRNLERVALATLPLGLAIAVAIAFSMPSTGAPLVYLLGGWAPPLGVALRADGLSAVMLVIAAVVICAIGVFAHADFRTPAGLAEARAPFAFWILLLAIWGALNTVFLAGDLFTLYVALELLTFAAVPLVCLDGRAETLQAALRYLLFALLGSVLYLVGTALLYGTYGTLDIVLLSQRVHAKPATLVAAALMTVGLLAKTALFPLHLWLPPAHAGAPAAGSAVLSALVVKGSFFIVIRLWFDVMPTVPGFAATQLIAVLGAAAILFGSVVALRQERLKLLIAYSTLAQIGYLFLMFPLAFAPASGELHSGGALSGGLLQAMSHATAKAAMFMSAGLIYATLGHDRIAGLGGIGRALPISVLAFALGGVALIGVPPGGAYLAKELLLQAAVETEQWWWAVVIQVGGIFTSAYLVLVLVHALAPAEKVVALRVHMLRADVPRYQEAAALSLALCSLLLGLVHWETYLPVPQGSRLSLSIVDTLSSALWPILVGGVLAILLGRWGDALPRIHLHGLSEAIVVPVRRRAVAAGEALARADSILRQWPAAGLSLLVLAIVLGAAMLVGR